MINGRVVVYLLIISYIITLGHNFIPHHHHHEDQENSTHSHHHSSSEGEDKNDQDTNVFLCIFSNILHHDDDGLIVVSSSENDKSTVSLGNAFGLLNETSVFKIFTHIKKSKHPPEDKSYHKLLLHYYFGLKAPPVA